MRIAIAASEYHRSGGFPRYSAQLATALARRGHEITVFTRRAETTEEDEGISFANYRTLDWSLLTLMASEPYVLTGLLRRAAEEFDAVICVGMPCLAPVVLIGPGTHRAYYLTTITGGGGWFRRLVERIRPFHWTVMLWERAMLRGRHPRLVVVPGEKAAREYTDLFGFPPERIALVPLGVELSEFRFSEDLRRKTRGDLSLDPETRLILHIGHRGRQKGLDVLMEALERLETNEPWHCVLAGPGSTAPGTRRLAARLMRSGRVSLLGRVESTRALYCAADLLLFPSRFDAWGLVVTEALACGLPVVCSAQIGAAMAVVKGKNGLLVSDPTDSAEIAGLITGMLPTVRSFDRSEVAGSVAWLSHEALAAELERHLFRLVS